MGSFDPAHNGHLPSAASPMARRQHSQSQWLFTAEELRRTPSVLEGLPLAEELTNRAKGVNFITQVGIALKLPQLTLATACVYLHRFFMRHAMPTRTKPGIHHYSVAATALFLATKVEENCRKMKELVVACCRVAQKNPDLIVDEQDKEFWRWRDTILSEEDRLLESLCFDLEQEQPYRILFDFMCYYNVQDNRRLRNAAWAFLNDSHNTTMCLRFPAKVIAGVAFYGGAAQAEVQIPDDAQGRPWWEHLDLDIPDICEAWNLMAEVYDAASIPQLKEKGAYVKIDEFATFDQTRAAASPGYGQSPTASVAGSQSGQKHDRDDDQGGAWGTSPKRQRRDSGPKDVPQSQSGARIPSANGVPPPPNGSLSGSRIPPPPSIAMPAAPLNGESNDPAEVQRRIDSIISASGRVPPPHPPPPPLSRVSSQQDKSPALSRRPSYQDIGRRSTSSHPNQPPQLQRPPQPGPGEYNGISSHDIPPLPQGNAYGGYREPPPLPRISSGEYVNRPPYGGHQNMPQRPSYENDRRSYGQERRGSYDYRPDDRGPHEQGRYNDGSGQPEASRRLPDEGQIPDNGSEEGEL